MTTTERYAKCNTKEELNKLFLFDQMVANTCEYIYACEETYKKRYQELMNEKDDQSQQEYHDYIIRIPCNYRCCWHNVYVVDCKRLNTIWSAFLCYNDQG